MLAGATGRRLRNTCVLKGRFVVRGSVNMEQRVQHEQLVRAMNDLRGVSGIVANDEGAGITIATTLRSNSASVPCFTFATKGRTYFWWRV
jgi:hypothetical protein